MSSVTPAHTHLPILSSLWNLGVEAWEYPSLADYNSAMHRPFLLHAMRELGSQWQAFFFPIYQRGTLCPSPTEL